MVSVPVNGGSVISVGVGIDRGKLLGIVAASGAEEGHRERARKVTVGACSLLESRPVLEQRPCRQSIKCNRPPDKRAIAPVSPTIGRRRGAADGMRGTATATGVRGRLIGCGDQSEAAGAEGPCDSLP